MEISKATIPKEDRVVPADMCDLAGDLVTQDELSVTRRGLQKDRRGVGHLGRAFERGRCHRHRARTMLRRPEAYDNAREHWIPARRASHRATPQEA